jgi:hypothetical protein
VDLLDCEITQCAWRMRNESAGKKIERDRPRLSKDSKEMRSSLHGMACIRDQDSSDPHSKEAVGENNGVPRSVLRPANSYEIGVGKSLSCLWHDSLSQSRYEISSHHLFRAMSKNFDEHLVVGMMTMLRS